MTQKKKVVMKNEVDEEKSSTKEIEVDELVGPKTKKPVDLESALEPVGIIDEKTDDEIPAAVDDTEESTSEEITLDDEELNPFGDKWEQ